MKGVLLVLALCATAATVNGQSGQSGQSAPTAPQTGQRRSTGGGSATLAIVVSDASGAPISNVLVTLEGPASRTARTEGGRIALENLPSGNYRLRFEREGFLTLERELTARGGAPIDVKVTLKPAPEPPPAPAPPPPAPVAAPAPSVNAKLVVLDLPAVIEKEFIGRAPGKTTPLACGGASTSTLIQVKQPLAEHAHANADEVLYVMGGEGTAELSGRAEKLMAGAFLFIPRGMPHTIKQSGRNPLILISTRAGEPCGG
jgi:mannose-6-phosphate isomerase-like protein (cupin superfamily)